MKTLIRGDTRTLNVTITDILGSPVNIGGHDLWVTFKKNLDDPDPGAMQVKATQPINADTSVGKGSIVLPSDKTGLLDHDVYWYDLQWVQPGTPPIVKTIEVKRVRVTPDVTRSTS